MPITSVSSNPHDLTLTVVANYPVPVERLWDAYADPRQLERFWGQTWNASVIWCKQSTNPPVAHQRRCCETLKGRWHELDTGHYPMLSEPAALARLIAEG